MGIFEKEELLPLPAEIRNEIYKHTITDTATTVLAPFGHKVYQDKHTKTQIALVTNASPGLIDLKEFRESDEYAAYLTSHGQTLWIAVSFTGRLSTFDIQVWKNKMERHMVKLCKHHPSLTKVPNWTIKVFWDPLFDQQRDSHVKNGRCTQLVNTMVNTLLGYREHNSSRRIMKEGKMDISLYLSSRSLTWAQIITRVKFGLSNFLEMHLEHFNMTKRIFVPDITAGKGANLIGAAACGSNGRELVFTGRDVEWGDSTKGHLLASTTSKYGLGEETLSREGASQWIQTVMAEKADIRIFHDTLRGLLKEAGIE